MIDNFDDIDPSGLDMDDSLGDTLPDLVDPTNAAANTAAAESSRMKWCSARQDDRRLGRTQLRRKQVHEWLDALLFDMEAQGRRLAASRFGATASHGGAATIYELGMKRLSGRSEATAIRACESRRCRDQRRRADYDRARSRRGDCMRVRVVVASLLACIAASPAAALADTTIDFEDFPPGTVLTNQYANEGGAGQGVVFGPLPGGAGDGLRPVVRMPPAGQAQSGSKVADIATCVGCEFFQSRTTGTVQVPRSSVSVSVGYLGDAGACSSIDPNAADCAVIKLRAFDVNGVALGEASVRVTRGAGIRSPLAVSTASDSDNIVGFEISSRQGIDDGKPVAIDDLSLATPIAPPVPDFSLNPATANVILTQDGRTTDAITIGRLGGSSGDVALTADGLPPGVQASFAPNPARGTQSTLTLTADPGTAVGKSTITITGSPQSPAAGPAPRSFALRVEVQPTCKHVSTAAGLRDALAAGFKCVFVENDADIDLRPLADPNDDRIGLVEVPEGVTLMSGRSPTVEGGLLRVSRRVNSQPAMIRLAGNARVTGLRLRGYQFDTADRDDPRRAIAVAGLDVTIDNNEFSGWPSSGVEVRDVGNDQESAARVRISHNFFHDNQQCNLGYGVVLNGPGFALIDHNLFNYNRHDIAGHGDPGEGYIAEHNFTLTSGPRCKGALPRFSHYNQHFDMHGLGGDGNTAGTFIRIVQNTFRGAQKYGLRGFRKTRSTFWLRGTPTDKAIFTDNVMHGGRHGVTVKGLGVLGFQKLVNAGKLVVKDNTPCFDTASDLAVGDFDGNGTDDVFQAVGTVWVYSAAGRREWRIIRDSRLRLDRLGVGDFDGDGKTDVFTQKAGRWLFSSGGAGNFTQLPAGSNIDIKNYRFGDFDGDGKTDVFRANGSQFFLSSGGATSWRGLARSSYKIGSLRFGDFDGDRKLDVFSLANDHWSSSDGGTGRWRRLNRKLSSDLSSLVFADFNGDRRTDVARSHGGKWQVSYGATTPWRVLRRGSEALARGTLLGDFDRDGRDDVLRHSSTGLRHRGCGGPPGSFHTYKLSPGGTGRLREWSLQDML